MRVRIGSLRALIRTNKDGYRYADGLPSDRGETVSPEEAEADSQFVARLFNSIRETQHFGVKMGYKPEKHLGGAMIFSPATSLMDFVDDEKIRAAYHPLLDKTEAVAHIFHTQRTTHRRIKIEKSETYGHSLYGLSETGPMAILHLGPDGELYTWRDCRVKLRDIALQKGKYEAYRDLQATVLAHYFDLTHRLDKVVLINKKLREEPPARTSQMPPALESIERLVMPRIKLYAAEVAGDTPDTIAAAEAQDKPTRSLRLHHVTWHVRDLPEGWHATPTALEYAEKMGVKLEKNQTIVQAHRRGSEALGQVVAYQFIDRSDED